MRWLRGRRERKTAERAAAEAARREAQQRAWHQFWDAVNVASGGTHIHYDERNYR